MSQATADLVESAYGAFNRGDFDFGYQWITRVARDPKSRHIVGDGIRITPFRLDASGRKLA